MEQEFEQPAPELLLFKSYIKYDALDLLFKKEFTGDKSDYVNIYIDLFSLLSDLYKTTITVTDAPLRILSGILNIGFHYRNFFGKRGLYSNIFFIFSPNMSPNNTKYMKDWYIEYKTRMTGNPNAIRSIKSALDLMNLLMPSIPDMFLKIGTASPVVISFDIIRRLANNGYSRPCIYVTRDPYAFQLPSVMPNVAVFFKQFKKNGLDNSFSFNHMNCLNEYLRYTKNVEVQEMLHPAWMTPYMVVGGLGKYPAKYGVPPLIAYDRALQIICGLASFHSTFSPEDIYQAYSAIYGGKKNHITLDDIVARYKCLDIYHQLAEYNTLPESKEHRWISQDANMQTLWDINNKYFQKYPLNIDMAR